MLDISRKFNTLRTAVARATVRVSPGTVELITHGKIPKGDCLEVAKVAAVQAAKRTAEIIPYCHPLPLDYVGVEFKVGADQVEITTTVKAIYKTGVEMEALTAAAAAALTIYDMLKMLDSDLEILGISLVSKEGGKSDFRMSFDKAPQAAVMLISTEAAAGRKNDTAGKVVTERLEQEGVKVVQYVVVPADEETVKDNLINFTDNLKVDLVLTTGGTAFNPDDRLPEITRKIIEREIPGIPETARSFGQQRTPYSMISRGIAGTRGKSLIVNIPGSRKGVADTLDALFPGLLHCLRMLRGDGDSKKRNADS
jgi:molybdenum cofactor biosynthesis protein MoaC